jgi:anti-anti-sigma factor
MPIQRWSEDIVIAKLQDDPSLTDDLNVLIEQFKDRPPVDVVLDFANVSYLNSSNIAKLLKLRKVVSLVGQRKLILCAINSHVWSVFLITGLDKLFKFADNISLGLAAIQIEEAPES